MESDPNQMSQSPTLCRSGCGFYGNAAFDGMCSMCYKDAVKRKQASPTGAPTSLVSEPLSSFAVPVNASSTGSSIIPSASSSVSAISAQVSDAQEELMDPEPTNTTTSVVPPSTPSLAIAADESASSIVAEALSAVVSNNNTTTNYDNSSSSESAATTVVAAEPEKKKKKKTRCALCRANVGVISFPCRCDLIFCSIHRYAKEHNCTFNYKEQGAEEIRKNNPQIIGEKVQKI